MSPYLCPKRSSYGKEKLATKEFKINKMLYFIKMLGFELMSECLLITNGLLKRDEGVWTLCESHNFSFLSTSGKKIIFILGSQEKIVFQPQ